MTQVLKPLIVAFKGKGLASFLKRVWTLGRRYGLTAAKMDHTLEQLSQTLQQFDCQATLPITTVALARNGAVIQKYQAQGIEFAVHGYRHVDHSQLSLAEQEAHLEKAVQIFQEQRIQFKGFRSPYLRCNDHTLTALGQRGFTYDSTPSLFWDVEEKHLTESYLRAIDFYGAQPAKDYLALPYLDESNNLVRIPYCLPDDESLIERLKWNSPVEMNQIWPAMFRKIHQKGELFTLGLHPERTINCLDALIATLQEVQAVAPQVWCARLSEITTWWQARYAAEVDISDIQDKLLQLTVTGPKGATLLLRSLETKTATELWFDNYQKAIELPCIINTNKRPFIGAAPETDPTLTSFLRQQGYIVETSSKPDWYTFYIDSTSFARKNERQLLAQIENASFPLVRLGRWPDGARSAFNVTGDIDALTIWDYLQRLQEK